MKKLLTIVLLLLAVATITAQSSRLRVHNYTTRDGMASNVVNCAMQDSRGFIWLGTNHGLSRFDGHRFVNFYVEENGKRQIEGIGNIVEDTTKNVLLMNGSDYKLLCFDLTTMQFISSEGMTFPKDAIIEKDDQPILARAQALGIDRGNHIHRRHDLHYTRLDDGRELFATIDNGIFIYDPKTKQLQHFCSHDEKPVIESDYVNDILKDRSGNVWITTTFAGIYQLVLNDDELTSHQLPTGNIRSLCALNTNEIMVSDMEGRLFSYHLPSKQSKLMFQLSHRIYSTGLDADGHLWIGTRGGGVLIDGKATSLPARQIYDIVFDAQGTAWIATLDAGLLEVHSMNDNTNGTNYSVSNWLQGERIHELDIDNSGRLWLATENGIFRKKGQQIDTIYHNGKVVCICHSADGSVWAGSNGHGLIKITNNNQMTFILTDNGLANNCVESLVSDDNGHIIAGTDQGISIVNITDGTVKNIYSTNGLMADTYNENAILRWSDGRIFLGSLKGMVELNAIDSRANGSKQDDPSPHITSLDINNIPKYDHLSSEIYLSHDQNNLCFNYSSMAYSNLSSVIYSYWLDGIDSNWRPSTKESRAIYTNLTPGHYRFYVRYRLAGSDWSQEAACDIYIAQPWYWTWWARLLYLAMIALFIWYELHQYQQRLSLRRQLDQRLGALYAVEAQQHESKGQANLPNDQTSNKSNNQTTNLLNDQKGQKDKATLDKLDRLILENLLQTDLDVNFIAQEMCMSYSTLHRRIKSLTGMTVNEYVRKHRLAKAMQLLRDGYNATEVSIQCGFNSPSYFTRCFKAEYNMLPSEVGA